MELTIRRLYDLKQNRLALYSYDHMTFWIRSVVGERGDLMKVSHIGSRSQVLMRKETESVISQG